jgi:D-sedoheptulose 7-phosphate isomerase
MMDKIINQSIDSHFSALNLLKNNLPVIAEISASFISTLKSGGKIIFMGNGGSAADSEHLAAELVGRFKKNRRLTPLFLFQVIFV